jgi:hypothetical protein
MASQSFLELITQVQEHLSKGQKKGDAFTDGNQGKLSPRAGCRDRCGAYRATTHFRARLQMIR